MKRRSKHGVARAGLLLGAGLLAAPVLACSFVTPAPFTVSPGRSTSAKPDRPTVSIERIVRGGEPSILDSCMDIGQVNLRIAGASAPAAFGYRFRVIRGSAPEGLFPAGPVTAVREERGQQAFLFVWIDGNSVAQEALDLTLAVTRITRDGAESEPAELRIRHPGRRDR